MIFVIFFIVLVHKANAYEIKEMDSFYQFSSETIDLNEIVGSDEISYGYGVWSKYNPLSTISQVGTIGLFDSDCFHIHNAVDQQSQSLNFIYYDCLDYSSLKIVKTITFIDEVGEQHNFEVNIDSFQYENVWFYFQIQQWPKLKIFELMIIQLEIVTMKRRLPIARPFNDDKIIITFGGGLQVQKSLITTFELGKKFSYFPGRMILAKFAVVQQSPDLDYETISLDAFSTYRVCVCQDSKGMKINDIDLKYMDKLAYLSNLVNCNSYGFSGWFKIAEIVQISEKLEYKFFKLSQNFEDQLSDANLSPFQLVYKISPFGNQIITTTYSYPFPLINLNFDTNPFLITNYFEITNLLSLWNFVSIQLIERTFEIMIMSYKGNDITQFSAKHDVYQFNNVRLKLHYGNIEQNSKDYLNIQYKNLVLYNCEHIIDLKYCHYTCGTCDGPTKYDCLTCSAESKRIYLPEHKVCICPRNTIDDKTCKSYQDMQLTLVDGDIKTTNNCQYGYYEYQGDCLKCPSIVRDRELFCIECLENPKKWTSNAFCLNNLYYNNEGDTQILTWQSDQYFLFDGEDLNGCDICNESHNFVVDEYEIDEEIENSSTSKYMCRDTDYKCAYCIQTVSEKICLRCNIGYIMINQICTENQYDKLSCNLGQYLTSRRSCQDCPIKNCKYCFEYQNDFSKCTLYKNFEAFNFDEEIKVGCALCEENYLFDFTLGLCIQRQPSDQLCKRSFVDLNGNEICTLAAIDDFSIAPQIINCQKHQPNCLQCTRFPQFIIKCIVCELGYTASVINGGCYLSGGIDTYAKVLIEGDYTLQDGSVQTIQSFMMKLLPKSYFYPATDLTAISTEQIIECIEGYQLNIFGYCHKSCSSECRVCNEDSLNQFFCQKCPLNYYFEPIRNQEEGQCFECTQLCNICRARSTEEIYILQPTYKIKDENLVYTTKCLKPINDPNVYLDTYDQIAKHCLDDIQCKPQLQFTYDFDYCENVDSMWENNININYSNQMGVDTIVVKFNILVSDIQSCHFDGFIVKNTLKSKIFPLRNLYFKFGSDETLVFTTSDHIKISNFDRLEIYNIAYWRSEETNFIMKNNLQQIDLHLRNFKIVDSEIVNTQAIFQTDLFGRIYFDSFEIFNSTFQNSSLLDFEKFPISGDIEINKIIIRNCTINQSDIFNFKMNQGSISIVNLILEESYLYNSTIFSINSNNANVKFTNFQINGNSFFQSRFQKSSLSFNQELNDIQIYENFFSNSEAFEINYNITMSDLLISKNTFENSTLFFTSETLFTFKLYQKINQLQAKFNTFISSNIWRVQSSLETSNLILSLDQIILQDMDSIDQLHYLFKFKCHQLFLNDVSINNLNNIFIFYIYQSNQIFVENIQYQGSQNQYKIPLIQSCQEIPSKKTKLLKIMGFSQVNIIKVRISNIFNIDESNIEINSNNEDLSTTLNQIQIQDIQFIENIVVLINQVEFTSLLKINSEKQLNIIINDIHYIENIFHSFAGSVFKSYASLIFFNCKICNVRINNYLSKFNVFTNSSNSFVYINSNIINFNNYSVQNHNLLPQSVWEKYFELQLDKSYNQEELKQIIQQILFIKNIGGAAQLTTANFHCLNCSFMNIRAYKSSVFEIITEEEGVIKLIDTYISETEHNLEQFANSSGCISIYSQNSLLNLIITNSHFSQVISRMAPSILSIIPSNIENLISIVSVNIRNCLSLINSFMKISFANKIAQQNKIQIMNLTITQDEGNWISYFYKIEPLTNSEIEEIINEKNALMYFESCSANIQGLVISGLYLFPVIKALDIPSFKLYNCKIDQIQLFYSFDIIEIESILQNQNVVFIQSLSITNTYTYQALLTQVLNTKVLKIYLNCVAIDIYTEEKFQTFFDIQSSFQQKSQNTSSYVYIKSIQENSIFTFNLIKIQNNNCSSCNGLMYFNFLKSQTLRITDFECISNIISNYGCINLIHSTQQSKQVKLIHSSFMNNNGSQGVAITSIGAAILLQNCLIINNTAREKGGGLYFEMKNSSFIIKSSIIIQNRALEGGGLYLEGNQSLSLNNFISTLLLYNSAKYCGNNLIESPSKLVLTINQVQMKSANFILNNMTQAKILQLKPYITVEQEKIVRSEYLKIPSNQVIMDYNIIIPKISFSQILFSDLSLYFSNSMDEQLYHLPNSTCNVSQQIITNQEIQNSTNLGQLDYNTKSNNFDLRYLSLHFNPNLQKQSHLQIIIQCNPQDHSKQLYYVIQAQSYKCQLGEFYVDDGCQSCQSIQGFYSVTYNVTKCSIFDKSKYLSITSNQLNLQEGYWRPHYLSDYTTQCFKNTQNCKGGWLVGDEICLQGHIGALCEECDIYNIRGDGKYFKNSEILQCLSCFGISDSIIPFVMNTVWAVLSIVLTLISLNKSNDLFVLLRVKQRQSQIIYKLTQDFESIFIKMMLNYFWIFSLIFTFNISFSFSFNFIDKASNTTYSMANNLDCYLSDLSGTELLYLKVFVILVLIFWQFVIILLIFVAYSFFNKETFKFRIVSNILLCLYILNYSGLIKLLGSIISLREISDQIYIQGDVSLFYNTQSHFNWMIFFMIPFLVIFGGLIPLALFLLIVLKKEKMSQGQWRGHICYLFNEYEKECYYWEEIKLLKKAVMILILTYFETNIWIKASLLGLCLLLYQVLTVNNRPYVISKLNHLDLQSGQICSISIFLATTKYFCEGQNIPITSMILQVILTILFILLSYPFIASILKIYNKKYKILFLTYFELLLKKLKIKLLQMEISRLLQQEVEKQQKLQHHLKKLRKYLMSISKAQIINRQLTHISKDKRMNTQQNILSTELVGQSNNLIILDRQNI
ncbi:unnamed protein product [Paramecium octaurelia]|uniref:Uncharacterized protein n=1 Tax=Paramecium octaurelia TaxID=43137 RepID=A0A8S1WH93_PAROT|nr:unnamed protein product [Paramecium octaurelia]